MGTKHKRKLKETSANELKETVTRLLGRSISLDIKSVIICFDTEMCINAVSCLEHNFIIIIIIIIIINYKA